MTSKINNALNRRFITELVGTAKASVGAFEKHKPYHRGKVKKNLSVLKSQANALALKLFAV